MEWRRSLNKQPFLTPLAMLLLAMVFHEAGASWVTGVVTIGFGVATTLVLGRRKSHEASERFDRHSPLIIASFFLGASLIVLYYHDIRFPDPDFPQPERIIKGIVEEKITTEYGDRLLVDVPGYINSGGWYAQDFKIYIYTRNAPCNVCDSIGFIDSIDWFFERVRHHDKYEETMMRRDILGELRLPPEHVFVYGTDTPLIPKPYQIRMRVSSLIEEGPLDSRTALLVKMLLLGDRTDCTPQIRQQFAYAGIAHIFALSGMHLGIIVSIILTLLMPLNLIAPSKARFYLTIAFVWIYVYCVGMPWSTVRAGVMATLMLISLIVERKSASHFNMLLGGVFFILLVDPKALFDPALQLSFFSVLCLIAYRDAIYFIDYAKHPYLFRIVSFMLALVVATLGTWAIVAYHFGTFSPSFAITNVLVLPLLPLYMIVAIIYVATVLMGHPIILVSVILDYGARGIFWLAEVFGGSDANVCHITPHWSVALFWTVGVVLLGVYLSQRKNRLDWIRDKGVPTYHKWMPVAASICIVIGIALTSMKADAIEPQTIFIHRTLYTPRITYVDVSGVSTEIDYEPHGTSHWTMGHLKFYCVTCNNYSDRSRRPFALPPSRIKCDYLIVGNGYLGSLRELLRHFDAKTVVDGRMPYANGYTFREEASIYHLPVRVYELPEDLVLSIDYFQ